MAQGDTAFNNDDNYYNGYGEDDSSDRLWVVYSAKHCAGHFVLSLCKPYTCMSGSNIPTLLKRKQKLKMDKYLTQSW